MGLARFSVPGEPQGKGRPRFNRVRTKSGKEIVTTSTPARTATYESLVQLEYNRQVGQRRLEGPLGMRVTAYYTIPKSASKRKIQAMVAGTERPTKKPDADNCLKIIADSLNNIAYRDDSQIVISIVEKLYDLMPRVDVEIWEIIP